MLMKNRQLTSFEHFSNNLLSTFYEHHETTFSLKKQDERRLRTLITVYTLLHFFSFFSINDHTASNLRITFKRTFHRTRVLFLKEFFLVYYSFFSHESFFERCHIDVKIYSFIHSFIFSRRNIIFI
jgi:hypothetical protein